MLYKAVGITEVPEELEQYKPIRKVKDREQSPASGLCRLLHINMQRSFRS